MGINIGKLINWTPPNCGGYQVHSGKNKNKHLQKNITD